jgi:hypothetical protein
MNRSISGSFVVATTLHPAYPAPKSPMDSNLLENMKVHGGALRIFTGHATLLFPCICTTVC